MPTRIDAKVRRIIQSGNLGAVIQCGGRGRRAGVAQPKPLALLPNGDRPLTNLLRDIPLCVPVYLHLLREQRDIYVDFFNPHGNFRHHITYLIQQENRLLDENGVALHYPDGTEVTASNGSATFARRFVRPPEYFALMDGAKVGVFFPDLVRALKLLVQHQCLDAVVLARELTDAEIESEIVNHRTSHTRYARVNTAAQAVYEHPHMRTTVVPRKNWLALAGVYVVRSSSYMNKAARMRGSLVRSESVNALFVGYAHHLKLAMTLYGYNGRRSGLRFRTLPVSHYIPSIKTPADIQAYAQWQAQGVFAYREQANAKHFPTKC